MPNWYITELTIVGKQADIDQFLGTHVKDYAEGKQFLDFRTVKPIPPTVYPNGVDLYSYWGTENSFDLVVRERTDGRAVLTFETKWEPPLPIIQKLKEIWPQLSLTAEGCCLEEANLEADTGDWGWKTLA